jgi:hypothetical protein
MPKRTIQKLFIVLLPAILLCPGCGNQSASNPGDGKPAATAPDFKQDTVMPAVATNAELTGSEISRPGPIQGASPEPVKDISPKEQPSDEIEWGREVNLDEMIAMAKKGEILEIEWHVMPNILRARASDGGICHLRNENKGVDLRNTLIDAGVQVGKGGVRFQHVF